MNKLVKLVIKGFLVLMLAVSRTYAVDDVEDFFSKTPEELAAIPVSIATGTPIPNFRSAGSASVITAEQIQSMGATELHEVLETVPGVHASLQPITNEYQYIVRGIANKTNAQMLILLNGTRITTPFRGTTQMGLDFPINAIQRVEVIRGPGSAVYGADAFAGVINIITKKARDISGGQIGMRAGNWDSQSAWGNFGGSWRDWDISGNIQYKHTEGDPGRILAADRQTYFDLHTNKSRASHAPGSMNTQAESLNTHINLHNKHWNLGFWAFNGLDIGTGAGTGGALDPEGGAQSNQYLADIRFNTADWFHDWELMAHFSYLHSNDNANVKVFPRNTVLPIGKNGDFEFLATNPLARFPDGAIVDLRDEEHIPAFEAGSIYKGLEGHLIRFVAGYRYEDINLHHKSNFGPGVIDTDSLPPNPQLGVIDGTLTNLTGTKNAVITNTHRSIWSALLQDEWRIADDWHLTAGVRYDHYSDFGSTVNPRLALVWDINDRLTSKLMYGKAFRAPSFTELGTQNNPILLGNKNLDPEIINTVELAFDYRPFSALRTALNLYYYHIEDLITAAPIDNKFKVFRYDNFGNQDGFGSEFEWNWKLSEQFSFSGNYSWQYARNDLANARVSGVPEHQLYIAGIWKFLPQWQFQTQLNWIGGRTRNLGDIRPLNDYENVDITLRGKKLWGHVNVAASLRNLFDNNNLEPARPEIPVNLPMPGRSFYFETSVDF